jgi:hypothetical protein
MTIPSDRWIRRMSPEKGMIEYQGQRGVTLPKI